jgi:hypothetical protein
MTVLEEKRLRGGVFLNPFSLVYDIPLGPETNSFFNLTKSNKFPFLFDRSGIRIVIKMFTVRKLNFTVSATPLCSNLFSFLFSICANVSRGWPFHGPITLHWRGINHNGSRRDRGRQIQNEARRYPPQFVRMEARYEF